MGLWQFINQWWNLPYLVPLGLVGLYFVVQSVGLAGALGGSDHEAGHELPAEGASAHEVDDGLDHDADQETEHEQDQEHDQDEAPGLSLAGFLGVGRVPFLVVWLSLFIFTGFTGLFVNLLLSSLGPFRPLWMVPSLVASLGAGLLGTRLTARLLHRLVDVGGRGSARRHELLGAAGTVASPLLDAQFGEVRVRDGRGQELLLHARIAEGTRQLGQGEPVVLIEVSDDGQLFSVAPLDTQHEQEKGRTK